MSLSLLVVEDNLDDLYVTERALRWLPNPPVVTIAADGEEALQLINSAKFDLILLDIKMPKLSGLEVLEHLDGQAKDVVVFTSSAEPKDIATAKEAGVRGFYTKPVNMEEYVSLVQNIVRNAEGKATG